MKPFYYDLHLHSCLSPCGDGEMTPNNLIHMALLKELDVIALTDHNTAQNCPAASAIAKEAGLIFLPGMELCTQEEVHVVCLFPTLEAALAFSELVYDHLPAIENDPAVFGEQQILNAEDALVGELKKLLINATDISLEAVPALVKGYGGVAFPAHIDRSSNSLLANLGFIPEEPFFETFEVHDLTKKEALLTKDPILEKKRLITNSDAHYLWDINERVNCLHLPEDMALSPASVCALLGSPPIR